MTQPLRVLHCIHSLAGGGAERQLQLLLQYSAKNSVAHAVFCVSTAGLSLKDIHAPVYQASQSKKWNWRVWRDLSQAIKTFDPHIVQVWLPASITIPALILGRLSSRKTIFSYRNLMRFHRWLALPEWLTALICSDLILSNTPVESSAAAFRWLYRFKKGTYIPNSVVTASAQSLRCVSNPDTSVSRVLFVGRLVAQKNLENLLKAFTLLSPQRFRLSICGQGPLESSLRELAKRLGIEAVVEWQGYRTDIARIMAAHQMLVLPSWYEGSPNVALEAMASGLPTVLSRISSHEALFAHEQDTLLVDPRSPEQISAAIRNIVEDAEMTQKRSRSAFEKVQTFQPEGIAQAYERCYQQLL
jgi:glycosyltransferase involved in cell wall biosynthesis